MQSTNYNRFEGCLLTKVFGDTAKKFYKNHRGWFV